MQFHTIWDTLYIKIMFPGSEKRPPPVVRPYFDDDDPDSDHDSSEEEEVVLLQSEKWQKIPTEEQ